MVNVSRLVKSHKLITAVSGMVLIAVIAQFMPTRGIAVIVQFVGIFSVGLCYFWLR